MESGPNELIQGGKMVYALLFLAGLLVGFLVYHIYLMRKPVGDVVHVRDLESKIFSFLEKLEAEGPNAIDKYDATQILNAYYGLLYLYPSLDYNTSAILAAAALDVGMRGVLFMPASAVSVVEDTPCGELVKAAIFAKLGQTELARERLEKAAGCSAMGAKALIQYCKNKGVMLQEAG